MGLLRVQVVNDMGLARLLGKTNPERPRVLEQATRVTYHGDRSPTADESPSIKVSSEPPKPVTFEYYPHGSFYPVTIPSE